MERYDIIIKGGIVVDGSGDKPYRADVGIIGDKIAFVGDLNDAVAERIIDADGKYVTPGFIDTHSHSDSSIWINPEAHSSVHQGITTEIVGNCGFSMRHTITVPFDKAGDGIECVYDLANKNVEIPKGAFKNTLDKMEKMGASINTAWLCGHNDLRVIAGLNTTDYTEKQFAAMEGFLREALEAGYIGFSTGLEFDPGILSRPEEVERLAEVAAEYDGIYTTHMRDEGTYILEAVEEFLNVIRKTKMRGMISHLNVKYDNGIPNEYLDKCMKKLWNAREKENLDVFTDMLSTTYGTGCAQAMLPPWLYENGWDEARKILNDDEGRKSVKADMNRYWRFLNFGQWDRLLRIIAPHMPEVTAMSFEELCRTWNREPCDAFLDVFMKTQTIEEVRAIEMVGVMFNEKTMIDTVVNDDIYLWMSDSYTAVEEGDARTGNMSDYMGYLYFFTRYVKELGVISIEKAVNKATKRVADHYRIDRRGQLKTGCFADINIFDINNLKISATFTDPCKYCSGFDYVIVNGTPVIDEGEHTKKRAGMVLRRK